MGLGSSIAVAVAVAMASSWSSDLSPGLGTSICRMCGRERERKEKEKKEGRKEEKKINMIYISFWFNSYIRPFIRSRPLSNCDSLRPSVTFTTGERVPA